MTDFKALIEQAVTELTPGLTNETHAWNLWNFLASDRGSIRAALLHAYSVDYAGLEAERDALRAQLDGMTTEWGYRDRDGWSGVTAEDEEHARRMGSRHPGEIVTVKRLVGGWVEVTD